jgi:hypothetical protein
VVARYPLCLPAVRLRGETKRLVVRSEVANYSITPMFLEQGKQVVCGHGIPVCVVIGTSTLINSIAL